MRPLRLLVTYLSRFLYAISCLAIISIVFLTVLDVVLRRLGHPIDFVFEGVVFLAAIVIGFALPQTTINKGHVAMEFVIIMLSRRWQRILNAATRCVAIVTFAIIGWYIIGIGTHLHNVKQVSAVLEIPEFPIAYGIGFCCFIECFALLLDFGQGSEKAQP
jgi:TRAP-type C4-dicarboxylate transport system permease small subunit